MKNSYQNICDVILMSVTHIFKAANIDEDVLKTLSREDLKDLFPGPENFLKRKKLWDMISPKVMHLWRNSRGL